MLRVQQRHQVRRGVPDVEPPGRLRGARHQVGGPRGEDHGAAVAGHRDVSAVRVGRTSADPASDEHRAGGGTRCHRLQDQDRTTRVPASPGDLPLGQPDLPRAGARSSPDKLPVTHIEPGRPTFGGSNPPVPARVLEAGARQRGVHDGGDGSPRRWRGRVTRAGRGAARCEQDDDCQGESQKEPLDHRCPPPQTTSCTAPEPTDQLTSGSTGRFTCHASMPGWRRITSRHRPSVSPRKASPVSPETAYQLPSSISRSSCWAPQPA